MTRNSFFGTGAPETATAGRTTSGAHPNHTAHFYSSDAVLLAQVGQQLIATLIAGGSAMVIATPAHRRGFEQQLRVRGLDPQQLVRSGRWLTFDAAETLAQFMVEGWPSEKRFRSLVGPILDRLAAAAEGDERAEKPPRVAAFSEMVALLWEEGRSSAATRLEQLWNNLGRTRHFHLSCGWPLRFFAHEADAFAIRRICAQHTHVVPASVVRAATEDQPGWGGALWQLRAQALLQRASHIARQTFGFYPENPTLQSISVPEAIDEVLAICAVQIRRNQISVDHRIQPRLEIRALPGEFKQIISGLLCSAIEGSPQDRMVQLRVWQTQHPVSGDCGIRIAVAHQSLGIPVWLRSGLFAPSLTSPGETAAELGLWTIKDLLDKRGGSLRCRSHAAGLREPQSRTGTLLMAFLPAECRAASEAEDFRPHSAAAGF